jgi:hypothetical protein
MVATTGQHSQLLAPGLRKIFFDSYGREHPQEIGVFLNMQTSRRNYEDDYEMAGLGTMPEKAEGTPTQYADATPGTTKRYTHTAFGLGFRATREANDDDLYGPIRKMSAKLGKAGRHVREVRGANVLNNAFSTSYVGFKASTALCSTSHALLKGGTASNTPSTATQLSMAGLEAALIAIDGWVDEDGIPIVAIPRRILIPSDLQFIAEELVRSPLQPESANNAVNPIAGKGMSIHVLHYLTSTTAWWVQCDEHDMNFIERVGLEFQSGDDFDTGDAKFKSYQRFSTGFGDWRGLYGDEGV